MAVVYAKETCGVGFADEVFNLKRGQAWDSDSDLVKAFPHLFEGEPARVEGRPRVERATRAPGEKRGPGRPRKAAASDGAE